MSGARAGVAGVYNVAEYRPEKQRALWRWAAHVIGLVEGKPADVVPLRAQRRSAEPSVEGPRTKRTRGARHHAPARPTMTPDELLTPDERVEDVPFEASAALAIV